MVVSVVEWQTDLPEWNAIDWMTGICWCMKVHPLMVGMVLYDVPPPKCCSASLMWDGHLPLASTNIGRIVSRLEPSRSWLCGGYCLPPLMVMGV